MNTATKAAVIEALENVRHHISAASLYFANGDAGDGQNILGDAIRLVMSTEAALRSEPEPTPEPGEREQFEAWAQARDDAHGGTIVSVERGLDYPLGRLLWEAWQACAQLAADQTRNEIAQEHERQYLKGFQAGKEFALKEAARTCDEEAADHMQQARGGDNSGHSDFRAQGAEMCAAAIRAMKGKS